MGNDVKTSVPGQCSDFSLLLLHVSCFMLVVFYVNMFQFWAWLSRQLGPGLLSRLLPIIVTITVLLAISFLFVRRVNRGHSINLVFLGLGLVGSFLALAIPDPNIPIKRIHVAEYIILSFLVRYTLSHRLAGLSLTLFTALVTVLLGVHDEMLQGFHPNRYYGWLDIIVNGVSGISGACLGHALFCFDRKGVDLPAGPAARFLPVGLILLLFLLYAAVVVLIIAAYKTHGAVISVFQLLPLAMICFLICIIYPGTVCSSRKHHGVQAVFWLASALLIYPLVVRFAGIEFV